MLSSIEQDVLRAFEEIGRGQKDDYIFWKGESFRDYELQKPRTTRFHDVSDAEGHERLRDTVEDHLEAYSTEISCVQIAAIELLKSVYEHENGGSPQKEIDFYAIETDDYLCLAVRGEGAGFDPIPIKDELKNDRADSLVWGKIQEDGGWGAIGVRTAKRIADLWAYTTDGKITYMLFDRKDPGVNTLVE